MRLNKYKLGNLIERHNEKNKNNKITNVMGISVIKRFRVPTSKVNRNELKNYKIVHPNQFAFVQTTHNEKVLAFAYNDTLEDIVVSSINEVFSIKDENILLPRYLQIYLSRSSFDRYARYNSWGSAREIFSWSDMCSVDIELPPLEIQKKYVDIYSSLIENQKNYEKGLVDLKLVCDAYIEKLKNNEKNEELEKYIFRYDERNKDNKIKNVKSVSTSKEFKEPTSKVDRNKLSSYKIVHPNDISFVQTTHNERVFANAINNTDEDILVTSVNEVFRTDKEKLLPEFLVMFFNRNEFDRYARYNSWGSAREIFTWNDLTKVKVPIPDIKKQECIVNIYKAYVLRKEINEKLKDKIKEICPILIKGSIEEAKLS